MAMMQQAGALAVAVARPAMEEVGTAVEAQAEAATGTGVVEAVAWRREEAATVAAAAAAEAMAGAEPGCREPQRSGTA